VVHHWRLQFPTIFSISRSQAGPSKTCLITLRYNSIVASRAGTNLEKSIELIKIVVQNLPQDPVEVKSQKVDFEFV
jgi:hypothetical protein